MPHAHNEAGPAGPCSVGDDVGACVDWRERADLHRARIAGWVEAQVYRRDRAQKHPVYDFLFDYYSYRPAHLLRWSPGADIILVGARPADTDWPRHFSQVSRGAVLASAAFPRERLGYLRWALRYLEHTGAREARYGCHGLHEWAMVYRSPEIRHQACAKLRLPRSTIHSVVESLPIFCTHFDAFRFFSSAARPLNRALPTRSTMTEVDQPGCIHVTMDLYRFAYKLGPFVPSDLLVDSFFHARAAREVDMRASPYDLEAFGFPAIRIETEDGRREYTREQRNLAEAAMPIRARLIALYRSLVNATDGAAPCHEGRVQSSGGKHTRRHSE